MMRKRTWETLTDKQNGNNYWYAKIYKQSPYVHFGIIANKTSAVMVSQHNEPTSSRRDTTVARHFGDIRHWLGNGTAGWPVLAVGACLSRLLLFVHVALQCPLGKNAAASVCEPVVNLSDVEFGGRDERLFLVIIRVRILLMLSQPIQHNAHRLKIYKNHTNQS